jgi:hypothetical protein
MIKVLPCGSTTALGVCQPGLRQVVLNAVKWLLN